MANLTYLRRETNATKHLKLYWFILDDQNKQHIPPWNSLPMVIGKLFRGAMWSCEVCDHGRRFCLSRKSWVGWAFEQFCLEEEHGVCINRCSKAQMPRGLSRGRILKLRFDRHIRRKLKTGEQLKFFCLHKHLGAGLDHEVRQYCTWTSKTRKKLKGETQQAQYY